MSTLDRRPSPDTAAIERSITRLEATVEPLFAAGRYRDFFAQAHATRSMFKTARLPADARERLWQRLNRCTEAAKERQARAFDERDVANVARWREQLASAERYAAALTAEIAELAARRGPPAELERWRRRIAEKRERLSSVRSSLRDLRRKIDDVSARGGTTPQRHR